MKRAVALVALALVVPALTACGPKDRRCDAAPAAEFGHVSRAGFAPMPVTPVIPPRPAPPVVRAPAPARPLQPGRVNPNPQYRQNNTSPWQGTPHVPLLPFLLMDDCD